MAAKFVLAFCAQVVLIQSALSQCAGGIGPRNIAGPGLNLAGVPGIAGYGAGCGCGVASTGGGFPVSSVSPIAPTGITIISENAIEGPLNVGGSLPFLGTVSVEGILPTAGAGSVSYGCGNNGVGIVSEGPISTGIVGPATYGPNTAAYGPGPVAYGPGPAAYGPGPAAYGPGLLGAPGFNGLAGLGCAGAPY